MKASRILAHSHSGWWRVWDRRWRWVIYPALALNLVLWGSLAADMVTGGSLLVSLRGR